MSTDPKTVREDDDAFCPHTAYPLQVTLTLVEGDMTVRHTECGRTVLTDWPYLRAHDVPLTLAYATDDQDEDWLELRLPAGLDEWLQEDEQQPADVVTAEPAYPGKPGDGWQDDEGACWVLCADGKMRMLVETEEPEDPAELDARFGPMLPLDSNQEPTR